MKNEAKKYHPTEEVADAARQALRTDAGEQFWQEVEARLDEYDPKIEPRRVQE